MHEQKQVQGVLEPHLGNQPLQEPTPVRIYNGLDQLHMAIQEVYELILAMQGQATETGVSPKTEKPQIAFNEIYNSLPESLYKLASNLRDHTMAIRQMVFG